MPGTVLKYEFTPDILAYGSYSRGYKAGGFGSTDTSIFRPEFVNAYEIGLKTSLFDRRLTANVAVYRADCTGLQESQIIASGAALISVIANANASRSQGVELDTALRGSNGFHLRAAVAYTDARYTDFKNSACNVFDAAIAAANKVACLHNADGEQRPFAPKWSGSVAFDYTKPVTDGIDVGVGGDLSFSSRYNMQSTVSPMVLQPGYAKLDARFSLGTTDKKWQAAVIGRNLTDKITALYRNVAPSAAGTASDLLDEPRTISFQVTLSY